MSVIVIISRRTRRGEEFRDGSGIGIGIVFTVRGQGVQAAFYSATCGERTAMVALGVPQRGVILEEFE